MNESTIPLIAHVLYRLDVGGLENGLVNLINRIDDRRYRHAIICMEFYTDFRKRIKRKDVEVVAIHKKPGTDVTALWRLYKTLKRMHPDLVHTRNLPALDALLPATLAGIKYRIHGEHGWDMYDLNGNNRKLQWLRKLHAPLVSEYVALSRDLENYLINKIGVRQSRIRQIYNGVDLQRFKPLRDKRQLCRELVPEFADHAILIGNVGRLQPVKNQVLLAAAFVRLVRETPELRERARLVLVGDGEQRQAIESVLEAGGVQALCWLPGSRNDIPKILNCLNIFVQPSHSEGISNTILEAMASGLPVIATDVGGNRELVQDAVTGRVIPAGCAISLAAAIKDYVFDEDCRAQHGANGRALAERKFGVDTMVQNYVDLYDRFLH